jgi:hypothetical protein
LLQFCNCVTPSLLHVAPGAHHIRRRRPAHALDIHSRSTLAFHAPIFELRRPCFRAAAVAFDPVFHAHAQISA